MRVNCVIFLLISSLFVLTSQQQTICCYWQCAINPIEIPMIVESNDSKELSTKTPDSRLEYIFYAPQICPHGQQIVRGSCRKIYE